MAQSGTGSTVAYLSFATSAVLTATGVGLGVFGIAQGEFKPTAIGLVLIFGGAVFALLAIATRRRQFTSRGADEA